MSMEKPDKDDKVEELTEQLQDAVKKVFESGQYEQFLKTMAKFTDYSANNCLLIVTQCPGATCVAGYKTWQKQFDRHVRKGEQGIRILAPAPYKKWVERECTDAEGCTIKNADGSPKMERVQIVIPAFKTISVFDISQTEGKPLPSLVHPLEGSVDGYDDLTRAISNAVPVPIRHEAMSGEQYGYYHLKDKYIAVRSGVSQQQEIKTIIHEWAHCKLHDSEAGSEKDLQLGRREKEVQAESTAYIVCQHLGISTEEYSFGYIAGWSSGKEIKELQQSLQTIQTTARAMITDIHHELEQIRMDRSDRIGYALPDGKYMIVRRDQEQYNFELLDAHMRVLDAGPINSSDTGIQAAADHALTACGESSENKLWIEPEQLDKLLSPESIDVTNQLSCQVGMTI